jgi:hypothetical protein
MKKVNYYHMIRVKNLANCISILQRGGLLLLLNVIEIINDFPAEECVENREERPCVFFILFLFLWKKKTKKKTDEGWLNFVVGTCRDFLYILETCG